MKRSEYNSFRETVAYANEHDPIWFAGWAWLNLTEKQAQDMIKLLRVHPSVIREGNVFKLPGGLEIRA